jgi:predicted metal-dependent hydrolase
MTKKRSIPEIPLKILLYLIFLEAFVFIIILMLISYTKNIKGVGRVLFERSHKAKHVNIYIRPASGIRVAVPKNISFKKAERIVQTKKGWIKEQLQKAKNAAIKHGPALQSQTISKAAARRKIIQRLNELSEYHGYSYNRVFIRNQKTRWGSCSSKSNISLNIKLAKLPDSLIDYVILHELVHTRIKNHSRDFWEELDSVVGNAKKLNSKLKEYGLIVI